MVERVIVAYDGSEPSRAAFRAGLEIAAAIKAKLTAVHLIEPTIGEMLAANPGVGIDPMIPAMPLPPMILITDEADIERARQQMEPLRREAASRGVTFEMVVDRGTVLDWLLDESRTGDLVTVGMTGRFRRGGVGSTTRALVMEGTCPVMVVQTEGAGAKRFIGVFDGTEQASGAVDLTKSLSSSSGWPAVVLAVARGKQTLENNLARSIVLAGQTPVKAVAGVTGQRGAAANEAALIDQAVQAEGGGFLVVGAYADSMFHDLFSGSATQAILAGQAPRGPVILVHRPGVRSA